MNHERRSRAGRRRSDRELQVAVETVHEAVVIVDRERRIAWANAAAAQMCGWEMDGLIGQTIDSIVPDLAHAGLSPSSREVTARRRDGSTFAAELTIALATRDPPVYTAVLHDISDRKQALEALRREVVFADSLLDLAPVMVLVLDSAGRVLRFNRSFEHVTGHRSSDVRLRPFIEVFGVEQHHGREPEWLTTALSGNDVCGVIDRIRTLHGTEREIEWIATGLPDPTAAHSGVLAIGQDITERRLTEAERRQAHKMEAIGRLAAGIAHDFNNLLMGIMGCADLALDELPPGSPTRRHLVDVKRACTSGAAISSQLMTFSRRDAAAVPGDIHVDSVIGDAEHILRRLAGDDVRLHVDLGARDARVRCERGAIDQVVMNLVVNAREAMPRGGDVTIRTEVLTVGARGDTLQGALRPGRYVALTVSDTGTGMDEEVMSRVFEPFFTTKQARGGAGLGLSTVYAVIRRCGGHVRVRSRVGVGTTFRAYLPVAEQMRDASGVFQLLPPPRALALGGTERILVVDDDALVRRAIRRYLERHGYSVVEAEDGADALAVVRRDSERIDGVVTDVVLPSGISGPEMAHILRSVRPDTPVVYVSAYPSDAREKQGDGGETLEKPFTEEELLTRVRAALDASDPRRRTTL